MKPYRGGVRHDYKDRVTEPHRRKRRWAWFALGLSMPLVAVALLLASAPNESKVPAPGEAPAATAPAAAVLATSARLDASAERDAVALDPAPRAAASSALPAAAAAGFAAVPVAARVGAAALQAATSAPTPATAGSASDGAGAALAAALGGAAQEAVAVLDLVVKKGDSLERLFRRNSLSLSDLAAMVRLDDVGNALKKLQPGDSIQIAHEGARVLGLTRELDDVKLLSITRDAGGYEAKQIERPVDVREAHSRSVIKTSLFDAASAAGLSDALTMAMAGIFQWDIDFIQDVRVGDTFTVIYQEQWRDGVKLGDGPILAAEFVNQGHAYRAARYTDATGRSDYYTPDGRSLRKAFIRAPVDFTRISSNFDLHRRHPILNKIRAHRGVDYAAPIGTPVHAAGDGKVLFRGRKGGYGNVVILQHGGNITTLYGHLSRFGRYKVGSRVRQGDVIAYVGMTGLATGPHLHYEYRINGVHRNPRTVVLPPADPVPAEYRKDFEASTAGLWRQLDNLEPDTQLATAAD